MPVVRIGNVDFPYTGEMPAWLRTMAEAGSTGIGVTGTGQVTAPAPQPAPAAPAKASPLSGLPGGAPSGVIPPQPGAEYLGMNADGSFVIWRLPGGSTVTTSASGAATTTAPQFDLPTGELPTPTGAGVTIGEAEDYRAAAEQALRSLGIVNPERLGFLTDADIDRFALAKMDMEAITSYYSTHPEVVKINPGAPYRIGREDYFKTREGVEEAFGQRFAEPSTLTETRRRARAPAEVGAAQAEPDWLREVFQERFSPEESASLFGDYFKRTGRPHTAEEIGRYRSRSRQVYAGRVVEPAYQQGLGPVATTLRGRERSDVFGKRAL